MPNRTPPTPMAWRRFYIVDTDGEILSARTQSRPLDVLGYDVERRTVYCEQFVEEPPQFQLTIFMANFSTVEVHARSDNPPPPNACVPWARGTLLIYASVQTHRCRGVHHRCLATRHQEITIEVDVTKILTRESLRAMLEKVKDSDGNISDGNILARTRDTNFDMAEVVRAVNAAAS